jgi:hypothetical protein
MVEVFEIAAFPYHGALRVGRKHRHQKHRHQYEQEN